MKKTISAGNDIIFLNALDNSKAGEKRFYDKIITDSELHLYHVSFLHLTISNFVWLLWSVKESAYKYLQRLTPELVFSPKKFIVTNLQFPEGHRITSFKLNQIEETGFRNKSIQGIINYETDQLHFRSLLKKQLIMTVVNGDESFDRISWGIKSIEKCEAEYQSTAVRDFLLDKLKSNYCSADFEVKKSRHGFPLITKSGEETFIPISLSHHYHFVAYSCRL